MKLLLLVVLCGLAASACAKYSSDYALFEDADILSKIRERVREGLVKAVEKVKELIEKFRPHLENAKQKLADLKERVKELATKTGEKLKEAVQQIRTKLHDLIRDVLSKNDKKEDGAVTYAADDDEQTPLEKFGQFIREGVQKAIDRIRDFINEHKDTVSQAVKDKVNELKDKVIELAKEHGAKLLEKALALRERIRDIISSLLGKESVRYAAEDEEETSGLEKIAQSIRAGIQKAIDRIREFINEHKDTISQVVKDKFNELKDKVIELAKEHGSKLIEKALALRDRVRDIVKALFEKQQFALYAAEEEEETFLQSLARRIRERLTSLLDNLKERVSQVKNDVAEKVLPKIQELREKIAALAKQSGEKLLEAAGVISEKIRELIADLRSQILGNNYQDNVLEAVKTLRDFFITDDGIAALKENAEKANPSTETGVLIKAFILSSTPDGLRELIKELFGGVDFAPVKPYQDIRELVIKAGVWLQNNIPAVRAYAKTLQTSHPVVIRLKEMLESASDDAVKAVLRDIFTLH